jgi:hypothetical protein
MNKKEDLRMLGALQQFSATSRGAPDRRANDRFPIVREVRYKVMNSKGTVEIGTGQTVNISSTGVLFTAQAPLPPGKRLEVSISWPAQLDGKCGLKLVARGRIVRCNGTTVALEIDKYEFRTAGRSLNAQTGI